ncbi:uncharacterized protein LOC135103512 [Scylla paramamosain]|uniref:uncharacterized protein LOC135103512 n=1 Tax=Scylla paramamosain TaxID=85552 RepID=UPI003082D2EC
MDLRQDSFVEVTSTASEEAIVSNSPTMIETVGGTGCGIPLEEPQAEEGYSDAPRVEVQMVGAPEWGPEDENIKDEHIAESSIIKEPVYQRLQLPEEEVIMFNLEEAEEGIRLVGKPVAKPVIPIPNNTTTISVSALGVLEQTSSQDRSSLLQVTQNVPVVMKRKFVSDTDTESKLPVRNAASVALIEQSAQAWLGCCLCYEIFPSRKALQLHVAASHQQPKTVLCQIPVTHAAPQNAVHSTQGFLETTEVVAEESDVNLDGTTSRNGPTFWPLPVAGKFMGINQVLDILKRTDEILESIPLGEKSNVFFVIKKKSHSGKLSCRDDCGDWSSKDARSVDSYFLLDSEGNLKNVFLKNNLYVTHTRKMKKSIWTPLKPQPPKESVLKIHRFYATLKAKDDYMKRLTCIMSGNVDYNDRMLVEYCGEYIKPQSGNSVSAKRIRKNNYSSLDCETDMSCQACLDLTGNTQDKGFNHSKYKLEEMTKNGKSTKQKQVEKFQVSYLADYIPEMRTAFSKNFSSQSASEVGLGEAEDVSDEKPKSLKQLIYQKLHGAVDKKDPGFRYYFIEEIAEVLEMLKNDLNVQEIIDRKDQPPCVILYSTEQICDMISEIDCGSVLGVNRTISFGACYITVAVYKSSKVIHKHSEKNPLLLGPMYLHWDTEFGTYFSFFSHLKSILGKIALNFEIHSINGHEEVLTKALRRCFPKAECTLCPKHLKDCMREYLCDVVKCEPDDENVILNKIFGNGGIVMSKDISIFEKRASNLQFYFDQFPMFKSYFDNMKPILTQYMWEPNKKGVSKNLWMNNNREPVNLIMKLSTSWRSQKLAALIRKICSVSKKQLSDMKRSLHDPGNYLLLERYKSFAVNKDVWQEITQEEQDIIFMKFLKKDMPEEWPVTSSTILPIL